MHKRCFTATSQRLIKGGFAASAALQQGDVLLAGHRTGVVGVDNVNTGACVTRQGEQVNALAVQQPESDGAMAKAVHAAGLAVGPDLEAGLSKHSVQVEAQNRQGVAAVAQVRQEEVVVRRAPTFGALVFEDLLVNPHRRIQRDDRLAMAFGLWQVHP